MTESVRPWAIGDIVKPASGGDYRGRIVEITDDAVTHENVLTLVRATKSRMGFFCRYELADDQ